MANGGDWPMLMRRMSSSASRCMRELYSAMAERFMAGRLRPGSFVRITEGPNERDGSTNDCELPYGDGDAS